ncbi:MAG: UvrD-helicase domain-containing protein, partial [Acidobacteriota bacterium]
MSGGALRDERARQRARGEHDTSLAVEAGAGTGKTTLLVSRIIEGLKAERYTIEQVAAITFTRKAAAELRGKIRQRLQAGIAGNDPARELLERARRGLPLARISTIHAFCHRILRQFPLEAGLDPDFELIEDQRQQALIDELWDEWIGERFGQDSERADDAAPLRELLVWHPRLEDLRSFAAQLVENPDLAPPASVEATIDDETLWQRLCERAQRLAEDAWTLLVSGATDALVSGLQGFVQRLDALESLPPRARTRWLESLWDRPKARLRIEGLRDNSGNRRHYRDAEALEELREAVRRWRGEEVGALLAARLAPLAAAAARGLDVFRRWARDKRKDRGSLSQTDLLFETDRLLAEHPRVVSRLCHEIRSLLVDEFQDTDPLQASIVMRLATHPDGPVVFYVGDPKQSIYRFRRADVRLYQREVDRLRQGGRLENIQVNFRSRAGLLDVINAIGSEIFAASAAVTEQAGWQDLWPEQSERVAGSADPALVIVPLDRGDDRFKADELAKLQAQALASEMTAAHERDGTPWRKMAVLFTGAGRTDHLEHALELAKIPYRQEKSQDFFRRVEVAELARVMDAIADPWDETRAVAALRSRLLGVSDRQLVEHKRLGGQLRPAFPRAAGVPQVGQHLDWLWRWHGRTRTLAPPAVLEQVLCETGFLLLLEHVDASGRSAGNVAKLLDQARALWQAGGLGFAELAAWLRERVDSETEREAETPAAEEEDRVALLTVHGAKGLEWDWVGLYDIHSAPRAGHPVGVVRAAGR